jgi:hypothetical protein
VNQLNGGQLNSGRPDGGQQSAPESYGEPWEVFEEPWFPPEESVARLDYTVMDTHGSVVLGLLDNDLEAEDEERYARRIVACVNAFAGTSTEEIEQIGLSGIRRIEAILHRAAALLEEARQVQRETGGLRIVESPVEGGAR